MIEFIKTIEAYLFIIGFYSLYLHIKYTNKKIGIKTKHLQT